ncbi:sigma-70 family RNA polymerase sigma factor [Bacillus sp. FJAT-42376]|uniref:sigma-70 family RNA polymerase sigma factor n=1 Tax=Bacillus sp. FJAT-42376 TaxID=2014076 RepID=UPI0013DDC5C6|nr:sigma-70 family RNA polymerase sigma factor [Bacillus sp. FJAT-42376]
MNAGKLNETYPLDKEEILHDLMDHYADELSYLAYSYVKNIETAKDLVQNTFVSAYTHLDQFEGNSNIKTWLYRITINKCKDYLKSSAYKRMVLTGKTKEHADTEANPASQFERKEQASAIRHSLEKLPVKYREVMVMMYYQDLTTKEIAEVLKIPEASVRTRLRRAKDKLTPLLQKEALGYE